MKKRKLTEYFVKFVLIELRMDLSPDNNCQQIFKIFQELVKRNFYILKFFYASTLAHRQH